MEFSTVPFLVLAVLVFLGAIVRRASQDAFIDSRQARSLYAFVAVLIAWGVASTVMGIQGIHSNPSLIREVPLLWQSCVAIVLVGGFYALSSTFRESLVGLALGAPTAWLIWVQVIRIGAIGSVFKVFGGEIQSGFPLWVGIPDFLFGLSTPVVAWLVYRGSIGARTLTMWGGLGAAIILVPTFGFMPYWMSEPGFSFIFEFPMVLAPSVIVPALILLNTLLSAQQMMTGRAGAKDDIESAETGQMCPV